MIVPKKIRGFPSHEHQHLHRATNVANSPPQPLDVMEPSCLVVKLVVLGSKWAIFEVERVVQWRFLHTLMLWVGHKYRRSTSLSRVLPRYFNYQQLWCFQLTSWCSENLTPPRFPATCYVILVCRRTLGLCLWLRVSQEKHSCRTKIHPAKNFHHPWSQSFYRISRLTLINSYRLFRY